MQMHRKCLCHYYFLRMFQTGLIHRSRLLKVTVTDSLTNRIANAFMITEKQPAALRTSLTACIYKYGGYCDYFCNKEY